jgi:hypothetical protein
VALVGVKELGSVRFLKVKKARTGRTAIMVIMMMMDVGGDTATGALKSATTACGQKPLFDAQLIVSPVTFDAVVTAAAATASLNFMPDVEVA